MRTRIAGRGGALGLLVGGTLAFFAWPLLLGRTYFFRDLYFWTFPQRAHVAAIERAGRLPLWDSLVYGGQPLLGNVQYWAFYPTALLSLVVPSATAVNLEIVLHFAACAAASYALGRTLGLGRGASAVAGVVFTFCGVTLSFGNLFGRLLAMPHTALLLLFWHRFLAERRRRRLWFALAAAAGALIVFAASAEQAVFAVLLAAVWGAVYPYSDSRRGRLGRLARAALLGAAAAALAAVVVLPTAEVVRHSWRGSGLSAMERGNWSVNPRRLPELVVPGFFGDTHTLRETDYWGAPAQDMGFPTFLSFYFGASVLLLAGFSAVSRRDGPLPAPARRLLGGVLFGAIVLSVGRFLPTGGLFDPTILLGGVFRYPEKFFLAAPLPAALLVGHAAEILARPDGRRDSRRLGVALAGAAAALALLGFALLRSGAFAESFERVFFLQPRFEIALALAGRFFRGALFPALGGLVLLLAGGRRVLPGLLAALVVADLASAGAALNPSAPRELVTRVPPVARVVREELAAGGRFYRSADPVGFALRAPSNEIRWRYAWNRETLAHYTPAGFGIPFVFQPSFDGLDPAPHARVTVALQKLPWERRLPILAAADVRVILASDAVRLDGIEPISEVPNGSNRALHLYRSTRAIGPARLVHFWKSVSSTDEAIRAMASPGFDPRRHAVLEVEAPPPAGSCPATPATPVSSGPAGGLWRTRSECAGWLVLPEPHFPGWRATLDGRPAPIARANAAFSAIFVPPGDHEVGRAYRPASLAAGAAISLAAAFGLAVFASRRRPD